MANLLPHHEMHVLRFLAGCLLRLAIKHFRGPVRNRCTNPGVRRMSFQKAEGLSQKDHVPMHSSDAIVLVVEDEILIRMDVVDQLTGFGYGVIEASSGCEALEALSSGARVRIVFTDIEMPGNVDGIMLAREIARTRPEIGIIVTSGKTSLGVNALPEGSRFYPKPYLPASVHAAIQEMLAS